ncbi:MAG: hypothetical protein PHO36_16290, partial [Parabacteroides sp.]|nr:hypothetical protein [Parabacteroides sp.]
GGLNLYAFVNNDPVNRWDKLGLIRDTDLYYKSLKTDRCYFSYNFGVNDGMREKIGDWINGPGETKWLGTLNEVEEDIDQQMRQRNCCCIPLIYFTQHSGVPGMLVLESSKVIMSPTISKIQDMKLEEKKRKLLEESIRRETLFLKFVSKKMCKGGKVVFVECMSGAGEEGKILKDWLNDQFGNNVSITLFETNVKWCWGWTWGKEREN